VRDGHRYIDSDGHVLEPSDLWERYLDPGFRDEMPTSHVGYVGEDYAYSLECRVHGVAMPNFLEGVTAPMPGLEEAHDEYQALDWSPEVCGKVLDRSGIDRMVVYPTVGLFATSVPDLSADTAAAYRPAYNRWLFDCCREPNPVWSGPDRSTCATRKRRRARLGAASSTTASAVSRCIRMR